MKNFQRGGFRGGDNRDRQMFRATCSECGKPCEVPFRPTGDKPVFCNDCFNKKRDASDTRMSRPEFGERDSKRDFSVSRDPRAPYKPAQDNNNISKQLSDISSKLDRLISAMENKKSAIPAAKTETLKQVLDKVVTKKVSAKKKAAKKKK